MRLSSRALVLTALLCLMYALGGCLVVEAPIVQPKEKGLFSSGKDISGIFVEEQDKTMRLVILRDEKLANSFVIEKGRGIDNNIPILIGELDGDIWLMQILLAEGEKKGYLLIPFSYKGDTLILYHPQKNSIKLWDIAQWQSIATKNGFKVEERAGFDLRKGDMSDAQYISAVKATLTEMKKTKGFGEGLMYKKTGSAAQVQENLKKEQAIKEFLTLCEEDTPDAVRAALKAGADPNASLTVDGETTSPLLASTLNKNLDVMDVLISAGAKFDKNIGGKMLLSNVWPDSRGKIPLVQKLLALGADVNAQDPIEGYTPLHYALISHNEALQDELLATKADVNIKNTEGNTPFSLIAMRYGLHASLSKRKSDSEATFAMCMAQITKFVKAGADINTVYADEFARSIIMFAVGRADDPAWVVALLDFNTDVTQKDAKGRDLQAIYATENINRHTTPKLYDWLKPAVKKQEHIDMLIKAGIAPAGTKSGGGAGAQPTPVQPTTPVPAQPTSPSVSAPATPARPATLQVAPAAPASQPAVPPPAPTQPASPGGLKRNTQPAGDIIPRIKMGGGTQ